MVAHLGLHAEPHRQSHGDFRPPRLRARGALAERLAQGGRRRVRQFTDEEMSREFAVRTTRVEIASGIITSSLYADGARAGLTASSINTLANITGTATDGNGGFWRFNYAQNARPLMLSQMSRSLSMSSMACASNL